ncbi:unnamed protein product [Darwinula stevensoni]|uniref:C-type lectin domain-containing protein n=1 Tax=Darwinula stevensoni TaxID=69355 RepID=A0A7R9A7B3_9CRUS|nr:unnamed protein product [Darwinula stevensoni]CAG0891039.1 unnamed protein product [Darwinula stevensoni]
MMHLPKAAIVALLLPAVVMGGKCTTGWQTYGSYCFLFSTNTANWADARARCIALGGSITHPADAGENRFIGTNVNQPMVWLGAHRSGGVLVNHDTVRPNDFNNDDNAPGTGNYQVYYMFPRRWRNADCNSQYGYICEKTLPLTGGCTSDYPLASGNRCFNIQLNAKVTRADALAACVAGTGTLATIDTQIVRDAIADYFHKQVQNAAFDSSSNVQSTQMWIGASRVSTAAPFTWASPTPFSFSDWCTRYPDTTSGNCVVMFPNQWSTIYGADENFYSERLGYVCRRRSGVATLTNFFFSLFQGVFGGVAR